MIGLGTSMSSEGLSSFFLLILYAIMLGLWRLYGKAGLYLYNTIAVIGGNIQALKVVPFFLNQESVALGTILFSTTFLASDILTEHYGKKVAGLGINISFTAQIIMAVIMMITLMYPSHGGATGLSKDGCLIDGTQAALYTLFTPSLRILIASLISYYVSQRVDIGIFKLLRNYTKSRKLWLRLNVSNLMAGLVDNILFSLLAWTVLSPQPVSMRSLIFTYILGTYLTRFIVSITSTPVIYLSQVLKPR
jgi:uncharacterized integral membrane protein (TIGR00697 family)